MGHNVARKGCLCHMVRKTGHSIRVISMNRVSLLASMLFLQQAQGQSQPLMTVGGERSVGAEFGEILDVAILPRQFVVLDKNVPHLRLISRDGRLLQTIGRSGSGPGEFVAPFSVTYAPTTGTLYVVDPANSRVVEYTVGDTLRLTRNLSTSIVNLRDVCVLGTRMFGISQNPTHLLDELVVADGRLESIRTLGRPQTKHPLGTHPMVIGRASGGSIECDEISGSVWVASRWLGELHRVSLEDGSQTLVSITGFHPIRLTAGSGSSLTFSTPPEGFYEEVASVLVNGPSLRVNLVRRNRDGETSGFQFTDANARGLQTPLVPASWQHVGVSESNAVCVRNDPYPTLAVFSGSRCP